jgi:argininosuccinate synthase
MSKAKKKSSGVKKVVLAYSGGLDTSVILKWLQDTYGCEVVTFTADLGQGEELEPARAKALQFGIKKQNIFIDDLREEFVRDFVFPMFRCNTVYEGEYLLGTSIARPLIAKNWWRSPARPAPTPSRTAPPARATTRCASSWAPTR